MRKQVVMKYVKKYIKKYRVTPLACIKVLVCLFLLWGTWGVIQFNRPLKLKDIAYSNVFSMVNKFQGYTVYLKEFGKYEPYLAISENYNGEGSVLLLRKYLLDQPRRFNEAEGYGAYYENSEIDKYLNTRFKSTLSAPVRKHLVTSNLEITARSSVGSVGDETTKIPRQVFLLSHEEMVAGSSGMAAKEGKKLLYFAGFHSYVATTKNGEAEPYWLRTPYTEHDTTIWFIASDGLKSYIPLWDMLYDDVAKRSVRPAFCLPRNTKLVRKEGIVKGKKVFVLKEDDK